MLYEDSNGFSSGRADDTEPEPQQLLADLAALVEAGLGEVRMTPTGPQEESDS